MHMPRFDMAAVILLPALVSCGGSPPVDELPIREPVVTATRVEAQRFETLDDTIGFHATTAFLPHPSGYLVVDGGNDRLVVLDRDLEPEAVFGVSGSGPGELEAPIGADRSGDVIAVLELVNMRISFFDVDGSFQDTWRLPALVGDLAMEPTGSVLLASGLPDVFLTRVEPDGQATGFAPRPVARSRDADSAGSPHRMDKVAVGHDGTVVVLDNTAGQLYAFDPHGRLLRTALLPSGITEPIRRISREQRAAFARQGQRVVGDGLIKTMQTQRDGRILLLFTAPPYYGLVVEPGTFEARLLGVPDGPGPWDPLLNAVGGVLEGTEMTVLHPYGVARYRLSASP